VLFFFWQYPPFQLGERVVPVVNGFWITLIVRRTAAIGAVKIRIAGHGSLTIFPVAWNIPI